MGFFDDVPAAGGSVSDNTPIRGTRVIIPRENPDYANAISSVESGGNYGALGPETGRGRALGKYQVMPSNVGPWSEEILGRRLTPGEFLADPGAQDAIFQSKFGSYVQKYGPEGAARAWFAGESGMNDPDRKDVLGTSVADYARKFAGAMGQGSTPAMAQQQPAPQSASGFFDDVPMAQKPAAPSISRLDALAEGMRSGVSFNFGDEISGLSRAGQEPVAGLDEIEGLTEDDKRRIQDAMSMTPGTDAIVGLARLGYEYLTGKRGQATQAYERERDAVRKDQEEAQKHYRGTYLTGQIGGSVMAPIGGMAGAATMPARIGRGAMIGAGVGALSGAGEGADIQDRLERGTTGGLVGAAVGAAGVPVLELGAKGIRAAVSKPVNMIRAAFNPEGAAERAVGRAYEKGSRADSAAANRLAPHELRANDSTIVLDTLGAPGRDLARSAGNISGEARDILNKTLDPRFVEQAPRLVNWLRTTFHYPDVHAQQEAISKTAKTVNDAAYKRVMAQYPVIEVPQDITSRPAVAQAMKDAVSLARNYGEKLENAPSLQTILKGDGFHIADEVVAPAKTSLRYWDYVKKALDARIKGMERSGNDLNGKQAADLNGLYDARKALLTHLDAKATGYADARAGAAAFFKAENALEAGQNFVTQSFSIPQTRAALAKMTPSERTLFQDGFVSRYMEMISKIPDRGNIVRKIYNTPEAKEKFLVALGPQRTAELEAMLRVENIMQQSQVAVNGGSNTMMQAAGYGLAGVAGGEYFDYSPTLSGILSFAAAAGKRKIDERVAVKVAEMLTSSRPEILNRGLRMIASSERLMGLLRAADSATAKAGAGQAPTTGILPSMQGAVTSRAQDEEPRPVGVGHN